MYALGRAHRAAAGFVAAALFAACSGSPDEYAAFHQAESEAIPGTFGYTLEPVEGTPETDPDAAYDDLIGASFDRDVAVTYAVVRNAGDGVEWGPAWVYFTHDLCYFTAKGDFVSPSRAGLEDGCTEDNMLVQVVDADTGRLVAAFDAFDLSGGWLPSRAGGDQPALTRFH
jgi:hypothetical protein